jgi:hypothetical protein
MVEEASAKYRSGSLFPDAETEIYRLAIGSLSKQNRRVASSGSVSSTMRLYARKPVWNSEA